MKLFATTLSCLLLLSSCGIPFIGSDEDEASAEEVAAAIEEFENENISLSIPASWQEIASSDLPVPKSGSITLALKSPDKSDDIFRTLVLLEDSLVGKISSEQYARNDYTLATKKYSGFRELSEQDIEFSDGDTSKLYTFEAKYNPDSPRMKFLQTSKVCSTDNKNSVYNLTIALPSSIDDLPKYEGLIKTLTCINK